MAEEKKKPGLATSRTIYFPLFGCILLSSMLWDAVSGYLAGGEDAPTMAQLVISIILMGGGAIFTAIQTIRTYKAEYKKFEEQKAAEAKELAEPEEE